MTQEAPAAEDWSWHDDWIHGFVLREPQPDRQLWHSELVLDIDHIVEWVKPEPGSSFIRVRIAPATLVFHDVSDLRMAIDFARHWPGNLILLPTIHFIGAGPPTSSHEGYRGPPRYPWRVVMNEPPEGEIAFVATGFTLTLRAEPQFAEDALHPRPPLAW
jgi:hypothetical protein